jgi:hypothetical protein
MQFAKTEAQKNLIQKINSTDRLAAAVALPPGTQELIRKLIEDSLQTVGKDPAFRREWADVVLEGNPFEHVYRQRGR